MTNCMGKKIQTRVTGIIQLFFLWHYVLSFCLSVSVRLCVWWLVYTPLWLTLLCWSKQAMLFQIFPPRAGRWAAMPRTRASQPKHRLLQGFYLSAAHICFDTTDSLSKHGPTQTPPKHASKTFTKTAFWMTRPAISTHCLRIGNLLSTHELWSGTVHVCAKEGITTLTTTKTKHSVRGRPCHAMPCQAQNSVWSSVCHHAWAPALSETRMKGQQT